MIYRQQYFYVLFLNNQKFQIIQNQHCIMSPNTQSKIIPQNTGGVQPEQDFEYYITADMFKYRGNVVLLQSKLDALQMTKNKQFNNIKIRINGNKVKQRNTVCEIITLFFGILLIFPIFFMCCKWWRKMVSPAYQVPVSTYKKLGSVFITPTVQSITLKVSDSAFNQQKANILYNILKNSTAKSFNFINIATPNNFRQHEYTDFMTYMKPLKRLNMTTDLKWFNKEVVAEQGVKQIQTNFQMNPAGM